MISERGERMTASREVSWWAVHLFVKAHLDSVSGWPMAGTVAWQQLPDDHPAKWAAVLDAAQHHALRVQLAQEALADASKDVANAADWRGIAREVIELDKARRGGARIERKAS